MSEKKDFATKLKDVREYIIEFDEQVLGKFENNQTVPVCLHKSFEEIRKMTTEEISEVLFEAARYCLYINRRYGKNRAIKHWAESHLNDIAAEQLPNLSGHWGWSERMLIAKTQHPLCRTINDIIRKIDVQINILNGTIREIQNIMKTIEGIKFEVIKNEKDRRNG